MALVGRCAARALRKQQTAHLVSRSFRSARLLHEPRIVTSGRTSLTGISSRPWLKARNFAAAVQKCPELGGESITEGTVMEWKKKVGDHVKKDEILCVIETDKVTVEVKADTEGTLQEIITKVDENVEVGKPMAKIEAGAAPAGGAPAAAASPVAPAASAAPGKIIEQRCADFGAESITEGTIMEWKKNVGDFVSKGEVLAVIETDKVSVEVKAEEAGTIKEIAAKADDTVQVGQLLFKLQTGGTPPAGGAAATAAPAAAPSATAAVAHEGLPLKGLRATFARLRAQRLGLPDPTAPAAPVAAAPAPAGLAAAKPPTPAIPVTGSEGRTERRVPVSFVRKRVMQRLKDAQNTAALLTTFQEADMSAVETLRKKYQEPFTKTHGAALGFMSIYAKASACALLEEPGVNALIDDTGKEIIYRDYVDLSVPIPSPRGPVSCVLRNVESKSVFDLEREIKSLTERARKDELTVDDLADSTFSIVDSAASGGMLGTNIINHPNSAILGTNAVTQRAVAVGNKVEARPLMYMSLTYDHRLIDGREAVTFLVSVKNKLEDPTRMLLGL